MQTEYVSAYIQCYNPSDDDNNLDYINAKPEQIQSEKAFAREMVTNKLENPETNDISNMQLIV